MILHRTNRNKINEPFHHAKVVPANAGTHTARALVSALEQRPFFTFEARGDGSLRSQGRLVELRAGKFHMRALRLQASPASGFLPCRRIPALCYGRRLQARPQLRPDEKSKTKDSRVK